MKVILTEDIKGKGKKYETKDFPNGYANFLIKEKKAVLANKENENKLKEELNLQFEKEVLKMLEAKELCDKIDGTLIMATASKHPDGSPCDTVTKKFILTQLRKLYPDVEFNSKMLDLEKPINKFGDYTIGLTLYPDIIAKIKVSFMVDLERL